MSARPVAPTPLVTTIALRFVAALQAGRRPSIEAALDSAPSSEWSGLLQSLLTAEVNDRLSRGETPHIREYLPRFPAHMAIVRTAFPSPQFASIAGPAIPTATLLRPGPTAFSAAPLAILPIPMLSTVPSPAIPIARAYVSPSAAVPMPIVEPIEFENFEPPPAPGPARNRRRRKRLKLAGIAAVLFIGTLVTILKLPRNKAVETRPQENQGPSVVAKGASEKKIDLIGAKTAVVADPERELAEWILARGGHGTVSKEVGGQVPFSSGTPLPKTKYFVTGIVLPLESASQWKAADLSLLSGKEKLVRVQLHHPTDLTDANLEPLATLPLQALELHGTAVGVTGAFLSKFPELSVLAILHAPSFSDADLAVVAKLTKLTSFSVNSPRLSIAGLKGLKNPSLRTLHFGDVVKFTPDHVRVLQGLPIEEFSCDSEIADDAFLEFAVMPNIRRFRLLKAPITDNGMKAVLGLGKLEELRAIGANIGAAGLEHLTERTGLKVLDISGAKLDNDALGKLLALPALKELRLVGSPISDQQVNLLAQLEVIEILDLSRSNVTDAGLASLKKHPTLKSLILTGSKVTPGGAIDFERSTPNCKVTIGNR